MYTTKPTSEYGSAFEIWPKSQSKYVQAGKIISNCNTQSQKRYLIFKYLFTYQHCNVSQKA